MKSAYQILRRPVITEKGLAIKENQNTLVFQVATKATKTEIKEAVQSIFKVKVHSVRTATYPGKERRRGAAGRGASCGACREKVHLRIVLEGKARVCAHRLEAEAVEGSGPKPF